MVVLLFSMWMDPTDIDSGEDIKAKALNLWGASSINTVTISI